MLIDAAQLYFINLNYITGKTCSLHMHVSSNLVCVILNYSAKNCSLGFRTCGCPSYIQSLLSCVFFCPLEQKEMYLDEALVIQQLRYTGMLETVRIRRSGYGAKYTFQVL